MRTIAAAGSSDPPGLWFVTPTSEAEAAAARFHFHRVAAMERRPPRRRSSRGAMHHGGGGEQKQQHRRPQGTGASRGYHQLVGPPPAPGYYTAELALAFLFVAVSLALLPLVLPPLAPPPALLLLLPVGLLAVLVALAFVPLDAHSYLVAAAR